MSKKLLSLVLVVVLVASLFAACGGKTETPAATPETATTEETPETATTEEALETPVTEETPDFSAAMITDVGGVNDESFNQSSWAGMERLSDELGVKVSFLESKKDADYAPNLEKMVDENYNIVWGIGFLMKDAIREAAESNPDQMYGIIDDEFEPGELPNVISVVFKAEESSFLVGYIASYMTETNHVGYVVGMESPVMDRFQYGYMAGVAYGAKEQGKEIKVDTAVAEAFDDSAKGKALAQKMYTDGADIVFHAAGQTGSGVIEAAKEMDKMAIGVDLDQNKLAPDHVITSSLKNIDVAIYNITERVMKGEEIGGTTIVMGINEGGVGIAPTSDKNVPADVLEKAAAIEESVKSGEISVPRDKAGYDELVAGL